ncbi:MAG: phosphotransferase [Clostridiales bacterium]|nr:phosphotransferase [Clostridiales bacterium]
MELTNVIAKRTHKKIYRDGDKCIKMFDESFSKADILNEALNLAKIESISIRTPIVLEVSVIDGKWAIVTDYIEGETMMSIIEKNMSKVNEYMDKFVDLQIAVHNEKCPMLNNLSDKMERKISKTEFDATTRYDLHMRLSGMERRDQVCHGDFNPANVIIQPNGEMAVIDWSHATQGNAAADVARTFLLFSLRSTEEIAELYLDTYCSKTDTPKQYIQSWTPIVAASQSVKAIEDEREFLKKWVNVVDYV